MDLDAKEQEVLEVMRRNLSLWGKQQKPRPVVSNLVFHLDDQTCDLVYFNVQGILGKAEDEIEAYVSENSDWLKGKKSQRYCFDLGSLANGEYSGGNGMLDIRRFAYRVCARLEESKNLGDSLDAAPDFVALAVQSDGESNVSARLRRTAREWLKQPAERYMRSFGKGR